MKLSTQRKHLGALLPKDDLLRLLATAWLFCMAMCVEVLLEKPKPLPTSLHFFVFAAIGMAGLCDLIFITARSLGRRRNWRDAAIGAAVLVGLTWIESLVIATS